MRLLGDFIPKLFCSELPFQLLQFPSWASAVNGDLLDSSLKEGFSNLRLLVEASSKLTNMQLLFTACLLSQGLIRFRWRRLADAVQLLPVN